MPICGIVIQLSPDSALAWESRRALAGRPEIELGISQGNWLPACFETDSDHSSRHLHDWIQALPGVHGVRVVSVAFDETSGGSPKCENEDSQ